MFLFTNAPVGTRDTGATAGSGRAATATDGSVVAAIREGAESSGVGFDYLLATAKRESSLDPSAKASTSSATGLYQFIEQTWLGTMKNAGAKLGLSTYADAITARSDGTYTVNDATSRKAILDLRRDPRVAAAMAGALTQRNREALTGSLGREPTSGDLYAAHVLGAKGATTLIGSAQTTPARAAALDLPEAAAANRSLFYDKTGRARGSAELYAALSLSTADGRAPVAATSSLPEMTTSYASLDGIRSLFQTDRRQGAVSEGVAKLWQSRNAGISAERAAPMYFPRSDGEAEAEAAPAEPATAGAITTSATTASVLVPLPPRRPAALATSGISSPTRTPAALTTPSSEPAKAPLATSNIFFDLSTYRLRNGS